MAFLQLGALSLDSFFQRFHPSGTEKPVLLVNRGRGSVRDFARRLRQADGCVSDFDGTLIRGSHFQLLREVMLPEDAAADLERVRQYFQSPELNEEQVRGFILKGAGGLARAKLSLAALAERVRRAPPRLGAVALLHSFGPMGRVAVISLGVKQFLERWCVMNGLPGVEAFALELMWQDGVCAGYRPESVVTDHNKGQWLERFCEASGLRASDLLVLGDDWTDRGLFACGGLNVFLLPSNDLSERAIPRQRVARELWSDRLDALLISDSLEPLAEIRRSPG